MRKTIKILKFINDHGSMLLLILAILAIILYFLIQYLKKQDFSDSRKSLIITIYSFGSILILLFFLRFWPPYGKTEMLIAQGGGGGGVTLNYGDTDFGKGDDYLNETLEVNMKNVASEPEESVPDEILTQDNVGAEVTTPAKTKIKPKDKKPTEKQVETPKTPVRKTNSALTNMIKGKNKGGDGDSNTRGNQGSLDGNTNSKGYYGDKGEGDGKGGGRGKGDGKGEGDGKGDGKGTGSGGGANYSLAGRRNINKPAVDNDCNSFGKVVIEVTVDKAGNTIGVANGRGTTGDACLIALAKNFARKTKWTPSDSAADKQVGTITYNFKN